MIKDPFLIAWLRLGYTLLVFFLLALALGSEPIRGQAVDFGRILPQSAAFVAKGPALLLYRVGMPAGIIGAIAFWGALLAAAFQSRQPRPRRWFYLLLAAYIVLTAVALLGEMAMGLIAMSHAL